MEEEHYTVSQVENLTGIKGHVLRYWEEELELVIGRNALGHRCYTRYDVQMFLNIKELKSRGLQLRAIKELVPRISRKGPGASGSKIKLLETDSKTDGPKDPEPGTGKETADGNTEGNNRSEEKVSEKEQRQRMEQFQSILERLIRQGIQERTHEERRCRSLDEAIRMHQESRKQAAAAAERKRGSRRKLRKKKKQNRI